MSNALIAAAHVLFIRDRREILLSRRINTGFADGQYGLPAGHVEPGERPLAAAIREMDEELGVALGPEDLEATHVSVSAKRVNFFFTARRWAGEPFNREPEKCDDLAWFLLDRMPDNMVSYVRAAIEHSLRGECYSEREG